MCVLESEGGSVKIYCNKECCGSQKLSRNQNVLNLYGASTTYELYKAYHDF